MKCNIKHRISQNKKLSLPFCIVFTLLQVYMYDNSNVQELDICCIFFN